jgi:hypothetical protein
MTVLSGISEGFYPAIFFVSLVLYLPVLIFIGMETGRYNDYMEGTHRNFIDDKWNEWSWGGALRFLFSDRESGDPKLITIKRPARLVAMIAIFGYLLILLEVTLFFSCLT